MHGKASERGKYLHCDDGIMALLILRMVDGRFWSTCYSTSIYLTGHGIRETCVYGTLQHHNQLHYIYYIQHMRAIMSQILALLVTPLMFYLFQFCLSFLHTLFREGQQIQSNKINKGEAVSTSSISSGAGDKGTGGSFLEPRILLSFYSHFFMQERGELYVAIAVSRLGVGAFPSYLTYRGTVRLVQWPSADHRWRSRGCFLYTFREGKGQRCCCCCCCC